MHLESSIGDLLLNAKLVEHALVERALGRTALVELVVSVLQALPVGAELVEALLVDVVKHGNSAPGDATTLLEAVSGVSAAVLLALHEVVVVGAAAGTDEVRSRHQRSTGSTNFRHSGLLARGKLGIDGLDVFVCWFSRH